MKKVLIVSMLLSLSLISSTILAQQATAPAPAVPTKAAPAPAAPAPAVTAAAPAASLNIARMEISSSVENREPAGIAATFPATTEKVYCYLDIKNVPKDTTITYVWTLGSNEMRKDTQQVKKSSRWRTWANKGINGMKGDWKVDVLDESGALLKSAAFKVE